jgi:anaerobic magnesium-protoporphyrin IX monomethyl ester cyclase
MPKVALVFPYFRTRALTETLFPPLGAANLLAQLHRLGVEARVFDGTFQTFGRVRKALKSYQPDVVGIYSMITLSRNAFRISDLVRADQPQSLLVAGGPLPTLYPARYGERFDVVFRGEADLSFPRFCRDLFDQHAGRGNLEVLPLDTYAGVFIQKPTLQLTNPTIHYPESVIQTFPLPERGDFDHAAYQAAWLQVDGTKTASIITTLGCPFSCDFCSRPVFGNLFRRRSLEAVFEEVEQIRRLGYDSLWIADDNFTLDLAFLEKFCAGMLGRGLTWTCLSRSTGIDADLARLMQAAGCQRVYLGLETGSPATLQLMHKQATVEDGANAVHLFHAAGVETAAFFIVGYPGETTASIDATFQHALTLPLDAISFNVPFPLPGSKLFDRVTGLDKDRDWNQENEVTFVYSSEFDPRWLRRRIQQTMRAFAEKKAARPSAQ